MDDFSITTPALLFPAITLLMLAYSNRFLAAASLIRNLHAKYQLGAEEKYDLKGQIRNLRRRLWLIRRMQAVGVLSFFLCVLCMLLTYFHFRVSATAIFAVSLVSLMYSLLLSLKEIYISTVALEIELSDMEG